VGEAGDPKQYQSTGHCELTDLVNGANMVPIPKRRNHPGLPASDGKVIHAASAELCAMMILKL
jgi:hypothetical protein